MRRITGVASALTHARYSLNESGDMHKFTQGSQVTGSVEFIELSALRTAGAGWVVNDSLVLTIDITVEREDRFQLDTGALMPLC
jgi:hypothetical protein